MTGPGASARMICMVRSLERGIIAKIKTSTPIPPTQCVKLLHNKEAWLKASTSVNMLEPVVVNPETVSKKQSTKLGISCVKKKEVPQKKKE